MQKRFHPANYHLQNETNPNNNNSNIQPELAQPNPHDQQLLTNTTSQIIQFDEVALDRLNLNNPSNEVKHELLSGLNGLQKMDRATRRLVGMVPPENRNTQEFQETREEMVEGANEILDSSNRS